MGRTNFTEEEDRFIRDNYLDYPIKTLGKFIGRSGCGIRGRMRAMKLVIPKELTEKRIKESRFVKGHVPSNKGLAQTEYMSKEAIEKSKVSRFKKGHVPFNRRNIGHEWIDSEGYVIVKISDRVYKFKHRLLWVEKNGPIPDKHVLKCIDGDYQNTDPSNWKLISMVENMIRNSRHDFPEEIIPTVVLVSQLKSKIKKRTNG